MENHLFFFIIILCHMQSRKGRRKGREGRGILLLLHNCSGRGRDSKGEKRKKGRTSALPSTQPERGKRKGGKGGKGEEDYFPFFIYTTGGKGERKKKKEKKVPSNFYSETGPVVGLETDKRGKRKKEGGGKERECARQVRAVGRPLDVRGGKEGGKKGKRKKKKPTKTLFSPLVVRGEGKKKEGKKRKKKKNTIRYADGQGTEKREGKKGKRETFLPALLRVTTADSFETTGREEEGGKKKKRKKKKKHLTYFLSA